MLPQPPPRGMALLGPPPDRAGITISADISADISANISRAWPSDFFSHSAHPSTVPGGGGGGAGGVDNGGRLYIRRDGESSASSISVKVGDERTPPRSAPCADLRSSARYLM